MRFRFIDANILLRIVTALPLEMARRALDFLERAARQGDTLVVDSAVVAEVVFVLRGPNLAWPRDQVVAALRDILALNLSFASRRALNAAIDIYERSSLDWVDCYLAGRAITTRGAVVTFDEGLRRLPGVETVRP